MKLKLSDIAYWLGLSVFGLIAAGTIGGLGWMAFGPIGGLVGLAIVGWMFWKFVL